MNRTDSASERVAPEEGNWPFLQHLRGLVEEHEKTLVECEQGFDEPTDATHWDARSDVVQLAVGTIAHRASSDELRLSIADTLGRDALDQNPSLFRIMLCFAAMISEMQSLTREALDTFMPALAVYDEVGVDDDDGGDGAGLENNTDNAAETRSAQSDAAFAVGAESMGWRGTDAETEARLKALRRTSRELTRLTRFVGTLERIWAWWRHVESVTRYAVQQLSALYADDKAEADGRRHKRALAHLSQRFLSESRLHLVWTSLGDLLRSVLTLDEMIAQNEAVARGLAAVHEVLALMETDKDVLWVDDRQEASFRELIRVVERDVLSGDMLPRVVRQVFDDPREHISVTANTVLQRELIEVLQQQLNGVEAAFGTAREVENEGRYASAVALHYLLTSVFQRRPPRPSGPNATAGPPQPSPATAPELDLQRRTLTKRVFDFHTRIPLVHLYGPYAFYPGIWMVAHHQPRAAATAAAATGTLHLSSAEVEHASMNAARENCRRRATVLVPALRRLTTLTAVWVSAMASTLQVGPSHTRAFLQDTTLLLQRGMMLSRDVQHTLVSLLLTHHYTETPITVSEVDAVAHGVQLLVQIREAYHNKTGIVAAAFTTLIKSITHIIERHLCAIASSVYGALETQNSTRRTTGATAAAARPGHGAPSTTTTSDSLRCQYDAITQAIRLVQSTATPTETNLNCLSLALDLAFNRLRLQTAASAENLIDTKAVDEIFVAFTQLQRVSDYQRRIAQTTNCDFLFWQRQSLLPLFFRRLLQDTRNASQTAVLVAALHDAQDLLLGATYVRHPHVLVAAYEGFVRRCFWAELVRPLCTGVENSLRLGTHAVVLGQPFRQLPLDTSARPANPGTATVVSTPGAATTKDYARLTRLAPFRFFGDWLRLGDVVEDYLDAQFYNLNALMPNDWETYEEMRQCALEWYGLHLCDSHLPGTVMDQGLDVLAITENIQVFIAHYTYNLDEQLFVQRPSSTAFKHLHTLHTRHIANSIRTHGTGIMNTTVNYVYKCLVKKLTIASQFLYDDVVRSRLLREAKFVKKQKAEGKVEYPLEHAEDFVREMKLIGLAEDGKTYLDKFSELVAEIGNALGYMRLVRSGGLRAVADAAVFLPPSNSNTSSAAATATTGLDSRRADALPGPQDAPSQPRPASPTAARGVASGPCKDALSLVDGVAEEMQSKLSSGSEYYRLLLHSVGARLQQDDKYRYLRLFYLIVPPMTLAFVDYLVKEKSKLTKQRKEGVFSDDGFALGCAFLMALFDVETAFDSLHWFDTMRQHYMQKLETIQREMVESVERGRGVPTATTTMTGPTRYADNEEARVHNMYLSLSMVDMFYKEYIGLEEAFLSSKILFYDPSNTGGQQHARDGSEADDESTTENIVA